MDLLTLEDAKTIENLTQILEVASKIYEKFEKLKELEKTVNKKQTGPSLDISKGERLMREKSLKKPVSYPVDTSKEERLKKEKLLKKPLIEENTKKSYPTVCSKRGRESDDSEYQEKARPIKKNKRSNKVIDAGLNPKPDLPLEFKNKIKGLNGSEEKLVIQKRLTMTDLSPGHNRLSMPLKQANKDFLNEQEKEYLGLRTGKDLPEITVSLIQPSCKVCDVTFKKWDMRKATGKSTSSSYVFIREWKTICNINGMKEGMTVQVWSFRKPGDELCFALVKVEEEAGGGSRGSASQSEVIAAPMISESNSQD